MTKRMISKVMLNAAKISCPCSQERHLLKLAIVETTCAVQSLIGRIARICMFILSKSVLPHGKIQANNYASNDSGEEGNK